MASALEIWSRKLSRILYCGVYFKSIANLKKKEVSSPDCCRGSSAAVVVVVGFFCSYVHSAVGDIGAQNWHPVRGIWGVLFCWFVLTLSAAVRDRNHCSLLLKVLFFPHTPHFAKLPKRIKSASLWLWRAQRRLITPKHLARVAIVFRTWVSCYNANARVPACVLYISMNALALEQSIHRARRISCLPVFFCISISAQH